MKKNNFSREETINFLQKISHQSAEITLQTLFSSSKGLDHVTVSLQRNLCGLNVLSEENKYNCFKKILQLTFSPFNIVLLILMVASLINDVIMPSQSEEKSFTTIIITAIMFFSSLVVQLTQENKYLKIMSQLKQLVQNTTAVKRNGQKQEIPLEEVVPGDIVLLAAGDIIPADMKLLETKDFFVKTTTFTGESDPIEKKAQSQSRYDDILEDQRLVLAGTTVISGYATGIVVLTGKNTYLGHISKTINQKKELSHLDTNLNAISKLLIVCIVLMAPLVFLLNFCKNSVNSSLLQSILFTLTIAFGLTPKMLPLIIATSFSKGIVSLSKRKVIVKNLNAISSFGAMNVLFTDKTGTLTQDQVFLEDFLDLSGTRNLRILRHAYLNSFFQTGLKSLIDEAIVTKMGNYETHQTSLQNLSQRFVKVDEIPFDFTRRRMSVVIEDQSHKQQMITKGAIEEILGVCDFLESEGTIKPLTKTEKQLVLEQTTLYNQKGLRVVGVAQKQIIPNKTPIEEQQMVLIGLLTFLDSIKPGSTHAIALLRQKGIVVKILTGDNEILTKAIAQKLNIDTTYCLQGHIVDQLSDESLYEQAQKTHLFIKLSPEQKARIVGFFQQKGKVVGFMGDGINDALAMKKADLGICVDTGAEITKEIADIILLEKQLNVLEKGVTEGRKTYTNAIKYIKFTLSANFGNCLSILLASCFLPFQPMLVLQILFLDLVYDLICFSMPFDNVESIYLKKPRKFDFKNIKNFMLWFGFFSFLIDLLFLIGLTCIFKAPESLFQTSWFIFSMWSQTLTLFLLRTDHIFPKKGPHNLPSFWIILCSVIGLIIATISPCVPLIAKPLKLDKNIFSSHQNICFFLILLLIFYAFVMLWAKKLFIKKNKQLL
ncbi:magnesium-translocating P-type ATPase ['Fragaria x ananassa' phyllody phytoplasma]|uniref:Magnesium-transporting ATPase, P-type 1 n=1 Tax='Fragaria x ananassa' phyllody phytoplasma TaxID=2358428 RepID=A0ABS5K4R6_9MOLU|nr:magnesium-translocating P-type ATPase ['Fragaria x ananassa' phyllody phytoplasma]MBS2126238.1 magnesium-translocating P-type ATPase ['Fragaria x ananassa' phyllody phytoplasma]